MIANNDENKVFYIGFRTPPKNSTGVAHILEHSVLCGSKAFPVKDPFIELAKGSLNTFLNAMTYPDKTVYPVASCNDTDFQNLMHVYLDAVFYPRIYENEAIFRQEGWHYEIDKESGELSINGVVYNEMKGAFSSPDDVLAREMQNALFPDTTYGFESGGDPKNIPDLTYEEFLAFHGKFYHPSNAYIYLYGNMDMAEKLDFIDKEYLSSFDAISVDSEILTQAAFDAPRRQEKAYAITEEEDIEENTYLALNFATGFSTDLLRSLSMDILDYALVSAQGAPLKQALIDAKIGKDVYGSLEGGIKQTAFGIVAKGAALSQEADFLEIIASTLKEIVQKGIEKKSLLAAIHTFEFQYRESDFGSYPKGLMYGLAALDSWLYDDALPFLHLEANAAYEKLRALAETSYFEDLIKEVFIDNPHRCTVVLKPNKGLGEKEAAALKAALQAKKATFSAGEIADIFVMEEKLEAFRETQDTPEALATLPVLNVSDLERKAPAYIYEERQIAGAKGLFHEIFTNGIGYLTLCFCADQVPEDYFSYLGLLKCFLGFMNTRSYSYMDLYNEAHLVACGFPMELHVFSQAKKNDFSVTFDVKVKALYEDFPAAISLLKEILFTTDFSDDKRLLDLLSEIKMNVQSQMIGAGHQLAALRCASYGSTAGAVSDVTSGLSLYRLLADLEENFEARKEEIKEKLQTLCVMLFRNENLLVDFTGEKKGLDLVEDALADLVSAMYTAPVQKGRFLPLPQVLNEGFITAGNVQYVCRGGNFMKAGLPYTGALRVLKVLEGYEYLWTNIRVKGGAYGCMCQFGRNGESYFVSYRDPNLEKTIAVYEAAAAAVEEFTADERTMTQYIIGAISALDTPKNPAAKGGAALAAYLSGYTVEMLQKERDEILSATPETIRSLAGHIRAFMAEDFLCVVGTAGKIKENENLFKNIENLF